eukprot:CAMPEP_0183709960 /NCGR_PEP_ID=MMETSP0737-20130205/5874_1 /TAXON_ID=385413 /ORGANISM="Thalassiosira miniscula, Strain CCMP1093" /LENGTH=617 /DNA_ID=CAMNT_0025938179 /DNA_START=102 /DNA_END=1955 /DNA_ORIENTATION=-
MNGARSLLLIFTAQSLQRTNALLVMPSPNNGRAVASSSSRPWPSTAHYLPSSPLPSTSSSSSSSLASSSFRRSERIRNDYSSKKSSVALQAATISDNNAAAEALFPSDDSDYNDDIALSTDDGSKTEFVGDDSDAESQNADETVDPIDAIADWVSDRFVEQSLQWRSSHDENGIDSDNSSSSSSSTTSEGEREGYVMESYSPGSTLDVIAQASSTYTPLSYQIRTVVRVTLPSIFIAIVATAIYPSLVHWLVDLPSSVATTTSFTTTAVDYGSGDAAATAANNNNNMLYTDSVLTVLSNDLSQYVQNILTTCALLFGMLVGQTYYFMYQQQEHVFYALFAEVTEAKSLLEQISLMTYGRPGLYPALLSRMNDYVQNDLKLLSVRDPVRLTSRLPREDPLESILYATSVGLPGAVYETVKSLRSARAARCGALQRKLPTLHVYCLRLLGVIVLSTFPVCGSGSQAIAPNVLVLQSYMFGILAFALTLVLNVVEELRNSSKKRGAYNVDGILEVMVGGLEQELQERLEGKFWGVGVSPGLPARGGVMMMAGMEGGGGGELEYEGDLWKMENEQIDELRQDIDGDAVVVTDGEVSSEVSSTSSRRKRIKGWLQRKVLRKE